MNAENQAKLHALLLKVQSLRSVMERIMEDSQEGHVKWVTFKRKAQSYSEVAQSYFDITGDRDVRIFDTKKCKAQWTLYGHIRKKFLRTFMPN